MTNKRKSILAALFTPLAIVIAAIVGLLGPCNKGRESININAQDPSIITFNQTGGENTVNINQISSQTYQEISKDLKDQLNKNFDSFKMKYNEHPKIIIEIESGNSMRDRIARDLESFLLPRNLGNYPKGNTNIGRFSDYPVFLFSSRNNLNFTIDFLNSIEPYIESRFIIDTTFTSNDFVKMYIKGTPTFNNNGKVKIE